MIEKIPGAIYRHIALGNPSRVEVYLGQTVPESGMWNLSGTRFRVTVTNAITRSPLWSHERTNIVDSVDQVPHYRSTRIGLVIAYRLYATQFRE
jgi:hypothetical protein